MELSEYISAERGRGVKVASAIDVAPQEIYQWASGRRPIPIPHCVPIEQATEGEVTRKDLRPDDWHLIWPELAEVDHDRRSTDKRTT